jgi:hypothetical protein
VGVSPAPPGLPRHDASRLDGRLPLCAVAPALAAVAELSGEAALHRGLRRDALARSASGASAFAVLAGQTLLAPLVALLSALAPLLWGPRAIFAPVVTLLRALPALLPQFAPLLWGPRAFLATLLAQLSLILTLFLRALPALISQLAPLFWGPRAVFAPVLTLLRALLALLLEFTTLLGTALALLILFLFLPQRALRPAPAL